MFLCTASKLFGYEQCVARLEGKYDFSSKVRWDEHKPQPSSIHLTVLFGADSFWEGISVLEHLKMVIIPRLQFRYSEPVHQARHERIVARWESFQILTATSRTRASSRVCPTHSTTPQRLCCHLRS